MRSRRAWRAHGTSRRLPCRMRSSGHAGRCHGRHASLERLDRPTLLTGCCQEEAATPGELATTASSKPQRCNEREAPMKHPVVWFEVLGKDGGKLQRFYSEL